jgi:hypothetical protein
MNVTYPEIRIKNAWLLRENVSVHLHKLWGNDNEPLATDEQMDDVVKTYKDTWKPYEQKILLAMHEELGLTFRQNIIDVNIAPWFGAFSDPMVIGVVYSPERFVEVLTHELIHRLLTDNKETPYDTEYRKHWAELFGSDHTPKTLVHIPVHATLQAIFNDHLREPLHTENDREECRKWPAYDRSWQYVEQEGYKTVLEKLRSHQY